MAIDKPKDISGVEDSEIKEEIFADDVPSATVYVKDVLENLAAMDETELAAAGYPDGFPSESVLIAAGIPNVKTPSYDHNTGAFQ